ncbi:hypothetical protein PJI16_13085 [Nitrospira sp. MA-1]|nr:hypothetical protein [Nitrospira sp. MA-1]
MNRFNIQLAKTIVPILLSVLSFGLGMWSKMANGLLLQNSTTEWVGFILIALLIPLYTIQISIQLSLYPDLNSIAGDIGKAISEGKVVYVGNAVEAAPIVIDRLKTASEALNTYLISDEVPFPKKISELRSGPRFLDSLISEISAFH